MKGGTRLKDGANCNPPSRPARHDRLRGTLGFADSAVERMGFEPSVPLVSEPPDSDVRGGPQAWIVLSRINRHSVCGTCGP